MTGRLYCPSPLGTLLLIGAGDALTELRFDPPEGLTESPLPVLVRTAEELREYFAGARQRFCIPLRPEGSAFSRRVWAALCTVPYGATRTYGEIARDIGQPKASRAVGMANHRNPIPILIPCHRVIGANGSLTGYGGGLDRKTLLLRLEREHRN